MVEYFITKKGYFYKLFKDGKKRRISQEEYYKKNKKFVGGGKAEQDACITSIFEKIKGKNIDQLKDEILSNELQLQYYNEIFLQPTFEFTPNICSYIVTHIILYFITKINNPKINNSNPLFYDKIDSLKQLNPVNTYLGNELKKYDLTSLSPYPEKSSILLNSCKDYEYYCMMIPSYLIADYKQVKYLCNSQNELKIKRINNYAELLNVDNGVYLYCILPDKTLCLFNGNHSAGACGQPVICAGYITILNNKITKIDNSSGHYSPSFYQLTKAIDILKEKKILKTNGIKSNITNNMKSYIFD